VTASGPPERIYRGPDYLAAVADGAFDPLVHPEPLRPPWPYRLAVALLRLLVPGLFRLRVVGLEHVPQPPYLIASNHQAWYDALFILAAFPELPMVYTMARRDTVFNRAWKRWLMPRFGVFPISPSRGELDQRGVATVYQVLARGGVVLVFPEGRYSRGRALRPLKKGVAHFALQAGVPICPVALSGLDRLRPFSVVEVSIGPPIRPEPPAWWTIQGRVEDLLERVRRSILRAFGRANGPRRGVRTRLGRAARAPLRLAGGLRRRLRARLRPGTRNSEGEIPPGVP
jgi:1-acyl-sn-glycerol-3-phosphate acyltransferase